MANEMNNMEVLEENVDFLTICRTCLRSSAEMKPLYVNCMVTDCVVEKLMCCTFVEFSDTDQLPAQICIPCVGEITRSYKFALKCQESHEKLKNLLKNRQKNEKNPQKLSKIKQVVQPTPTVKERTLNYRERAKISERKQRLIKIAQQVRDYEKQKKLVRLKEVNRNLLEYMNVQRRENLWNRSGTTIDFEPVDRAQVTFDPFSFELGEISYSDFIDDELRRHDVDNSTRSSANNNQSRSHTTTSPLNDFEIIKTEEFEFEEHKMEEIKPLKFELNLATCQNEHFENLRHSADELLKVELFNLKTEESDFSSSNFQVNSSNFQVNSSNLPLNSSNLPPAQLKTDSRVLIDSTAASNDQNPATTLNTPGLSVDSASFPLRLKPIGELVTNNVKQLQNTASKTSAKIVKCKIPITASSKLSNVIKKLANSSKQTKLKLVLKSTDLENKSDLVEKLSKKLSDPKCVIKNLKQKKRVDPIDLIEDDDDDDNAGNDPTTGSKQELNQSTDFYTNYNFTSFIKPDGTTKY